MGNKIKNRNDRPTFEQFKAKALQKPEVKVEYDALSYDEQLKMVQDALAMAETKGFTDESTEQIKQRVIQRKRHD
jgi:hypothetical protein